MKKFYTYIYRDSGIPFYVGKGTGDRMYRHLKNKGTHFTNRVQKLIREGNPPTIEIIDALNEDHAKFLEVCLIDIFGRADLGKGPLLNLTNGGDGRNEWNEQQKIEHSKKITGQKRSDETCLKMSRSAVERCKIKSPVDNFGDERGRKKGSITSDDHKMKLRDAQTGKKQSEETKLKIAATRKATEAKKKLHDLSIVTK